MIVTKEQQQQRFVRDMRDKYGDNLDYHQLFGLIKNGDTNNNNNNNGQSMDSPVPRQQRVKVKHIQSQQRTGRKFLTRRQDGNTTTSIFQHETSTVTNHDDGTNTHAWTPNRFQQGLVDQNN